MAEKPDPGIRRTAGRIVRFLLLVVLLGIAVIIGSMLEPLTLFFSEIITTSTHTPTNTPTSTNTPSSTPTRLAEDSPKLSYIILAPENAKLEYDATTGRGTVTWDSSDWMPTEPAGTAAIRYELSVTYPEFLLGPFVIDEENSYTFTALNAHRYETVIVSLRAVGTLRIGQYEYEFGSDIVEIVWTTSTATPSFTPSDTFTPTLTHTPTDTPTATDTSTATYTPTSTNTNTSTATPTATSTNTFTPTATDTSTSTNTYTPTSTATKTDTNTPTHTSTSTPTHTFTPSDTPKPTSTDTPSRTPTPTQTFTPTDTNTPTYTYTPSTTPTPTLTPTETFTPSDTPTATDSPTATLTFTPSATFTPDINKMAVLFEVITDGVVNIRRCPATTCNPRLGVSRRGQVIEVFGRIAGSDGEWYLIRFEDRPAYIAGWLTTTTSDATATSRAATATSNAATSRARSAARSRDANASATARARKTANAISSQAIETDRTYRVRFSDLFNTLCMVGPTETEGSNIIVIAGEDKYAAEMLVTLPNESKPLKAIREQSDREMVPGETVRLIFLENPNVAFQPGFYKLELRLRDSYTHTAFWRVRRAGNYGISVVCS